MTGKKDLDQKPQIRAYPSNLCHPCSLRFDEYYDVAMITECILCKTCKELDIEIIEIAFNPDHVHIFFKYPPKYSLSFIAKRLKGRTNRILRKEFPHLKEYMKIISGRQVVSTDQSGMAGMLSRSI